MGGLFGGGGMGEKTTTSTTNQTTNNVTQTTVNDSRIGASDNALVMTGGGNQVLRENAQSFSIGAGGSGVVGGVGSTNVGGDLNVTQTDFGSVKAALEFADRFGGDSLAKMQTMTSQNTDALLQTTGKAVDSVLTASNSRTSEVTQRNLLIGGVLIVGAFLIYKWK